jgi:hypothetical protein
MTSGPALGLSRGTPPLDEGLTRLLSHNILCSSDAILMSGTVLCLYLNRQ